MSDYGLTDDDPDVYHLVRDDKVLCRRFAETHFEPASKADLFGLKLCPDCDDAVSEIEHVTTVLDKTEVPEE